MSGSDRERWDGRYAALGPGTPMPPDALRARLHLLPTASGIHNAPEDGAGARCGSAVADRPERGAPRARGPLRALDVACGRGTVAVWLAMRRFVVDAVDVSGAGLAAARTLAREAGVPVVDQAGALPGDAGAVRFVEADLDAGLPVAGPYDLVVCQRFRDPALYPALAAALAPGGLLAITVLSEVGEEPGRFRAPAGELARAFADLDVLAHEEGDGEATLLARRR